MDLEPELGTRRINAHCASRRGAARSVVRDRRVIARPIWQLVSRVLGVLHTALTVVVVTVFAYVVAGLLLILYFLAFRYSEF